NDVLTTSTPLLTEVASQYESKTSPVSGYRSGIFKQWDASSPFLSLVDGFDIVHLTGVNGRDSLLSGSDNCAPFLPPDGRAGYFRQLFNGIWGEICPALIAYVIIGDAPNTSGDLVNFMRLAGNPAVSGTARIHFGLVHADRVEARVYDV